ncbi:MAG: hypothetical protein CSB44_08515 [Gammaproteobacteria bacterium]|nr:MAG: hypothetical protein CSB44_08515 [Gammaproteobacteria bacterium]
MNEVKRVLQSSRLLPPGIATAVYFTLLLFLVRFVDVFYLRSDEWFGEQVVTKVAGIICILLYLWFHRLPLRSIGLNRFRLQEALFWGTAIILLALAAGYFSEWLFLLLVGQGPTFHVNPQGNSLVPDVPVYGSLGFAAILLAGNVVNSLMEEGFFRGFLLFQLEGRVSVRVAVLVQAVLFGLWHLFWPVRDFLTGQTDLLTCVVTCLVYGSISTVIGIAWGLLYCRTRNLWSVIVAHTLNNSVLNVLHITAIDGPPGTIGIRTTVIVIVFLVSTLLLVRFGKKDSEPNVRGASFR